jgi:hypothetical protein
MKENWEKGRGGGDKEKRSKEEKIRNKNLREKVL